MSQAHAVLRAVADHYRANPDSWTTGFGTVNNRWFWGFGGGIGPQETGCADTMIRFFSRQFGWRGARQRADEATILLCLHHGLAPQRLAVMLHNDHCFIGVEDAIKFFEAPLGISDAPKLSDIDSLIPEPGATKKRVYAMAVVALCVGILGLASQMPLV